MILFSGLKISESLPEQNALFDELPTVHQSRYIDTILLQTARLP
jgi:hypothetical protein